MWLVVLVLADIDGPCALIVNLQVPERFLLNVAEAHVLAHLDASQIFNPSDRLSQLLVRYFVVAHELSDHSKEVA